MKHMNKRMMLTILLLGIIVVGLSTVYANSINKVMKPIQKYNSKGSIIKETAKATKIGKEDVQKIAKNITEKFGFKGQEIIEQKLLEDEYSSKVYWSNKTKDCEVEINADTGDLKKIKYLNYNYDYPTKADAQSATKAAKEIYKNMQLSEKYELMYINYFTENLWEAYWAPKYDELYNTYQGIKMYFNPDNSSVMTISKFDSNFDNNEVIIKSDEAKSLAKPIMDKLGISEIKQVKLQIIEANYMWEKDNTSAKKTNLIRKAWIVYCNDKLETKIYIDATTGEIIGGDKLK